MIQSGKFPSRIQIIRYRYNFHKTDQFDFLENVMFAIIFIKIRYNGKEQIRYGTLLNQFELPSHR
jgi:hypothetical protein